MKRWALIFNKSQAGDATGGVLVSTAATVGILDKAVSITHKLTNKSDEVDKATQKRGLDNLMVELTSAKIEAKTTQTCFRLRTEKHAWTHCRRRENLY
jgi:hypothetical protein